MTQRRQREVALGALELDLENPRHPPARNEEEAIRILIEDENMLALAKDIAIRGELSPIEVIGVLPHPTKRNHFVVAEGNRRVAALKLLKNPSLAPDADTRRAIERALKAGSAPTGKISVIQFASAADAHRWKSLRHEGGQRGVGTKAWNSAQQTRHVRASGRAHPNTLAQDVIDHARAHGLLTDDNVDKLSITTIRRFLSTPEVRHELGITSGNELEIGVDEGEFNRAITRFLSDAIGGDAAVNSRADVNARRAYAKRLRKEGISPKTHIATPAKPSPVPAAKTRVARFKPAPDPADRPGVVPPSFSPKFVDNRLQYLFRELQSIDPDQFKFAAAYLYRAFLETLVKRCAQKRNLPYSAERELHVIMQRVHADLLNDQALIQIHGAALSKRLKPFIDAANKRDDRNNPQVLGSMVHGGTLPSRKELISCWDALDFAWPLLSAGL